MELLRTITERLVTAVAAVYTPFMKPKSCWGSKLDDAVGGCAVMAAGQGWDQGAIGPGQRWDKVGPAELEQGCGL